MVSEINEYRHTMYYSLLITNYLNFLLPALLVACTVYERIYGSLAAHEYIYDALWFHLLWGVVIVYASYRCVRSGIWRRPLTALLHLSLVTIALGISLTTFTSRRGRLHFRQGVPTSIFFTETHRVVTLPETLTLEGVYTAHTHTYYLLRSDRDSLYTLASNSVVQIGDYRIYLTSADADLQGVNVKIINDRNGRNLSRLGFYLFLVILLLKLAQLPFRAYRWAKRRAFRWTDLRCRTRIFSIALFACSALYFLFEWAHQGFVPLITITDTLLVVSILLSLLSLIIAKNARLQNIVHLFGWALLIITLMTNDYSTVAPRTLPQALNSRWLSIHVSTIILAYSMLTICSLHSFISVIHKRNAPSSPRSRSSHAFLRYSVYLLTAGIIFGTLWAGDAWGDYWSWDAKELWALITLLLYTIPLHKATSDDLYHRYIIIAFLALLMTYLGVTYLLGGMHGY